jgi:hypothetical protein
VQVQISAARAPCCRFFDNWRLVTTRIDSEFLDRHWVGCLTSRLHLPTCLDAGIVIQFLRSVARPLRWPE